MSHFDEMVPRFHRAECTFYEKVAPLVADMPLAKVYYTREWLPGKQEGVLLMEDLSEKAATMCLHQTFNLTQVKESEDSVESAVGFPKVPLFGAVPSFR